jgi:copper chaperone CopZ
MKNLPVLLATFALAAAGLSGCAAGGEKPAAVSPAASRTVTVAVDGMVCNFCATNIDKTLAKLPGVTAVYIHLGEGVALLGVNDPALPAEADIRKAVDEAGFAVTEIKRSDTAFAASRDALKAKTLKNL